MRRGWAVAATALLVVAGCPWLAPAAEAHPGDIAGEAPGNSAGLAGIPFRGPAGSTIATTPCPPISDSAAPQYDDPSTGHLGHIADIQEVEGAANNFLIKDSVDLFHLQDPYNNPRGIERTEEPLDPDALLGDTSVMMGPDGFFRGQLKETLYDTDGADLVVVDVHDWRAYCIYGGIEPDGPFLFIDSTFNDPTLIQYTYLDLSTFYLPIWEATFQGDDEPRVDYVFLITSAFEDDDNPTVNPPSAGFTAINPQACGTSTITFTATVQDIDGQVVSLLWDFGDSSQASGEAVQHAFATTEAYTVTLTAVDDDALATVVTQQVYGVEAVNCCPTLDVPTLINVGEGDHIGFVALGFDPDLDALAYSLLPFPAAAGFTPSGVFGWQTAVGDAGWYTATIEVTDGQCVVQRPVRIGVHPEGTYDAVEDRDWDSIEDESDNCPGIRNRDQEDIDLDGIGDACDEAAPNQHQGQGAPGAAGAHADADGDGITDATDTCPAVPDTTQTDSDADGAGDACDIDADGDLVPEQGTTGLFLDNCPMTPNADQADRDDDGRGDRCDATPGAARLDAADEAAATARPTAAPAGTPPTFWLLAVAVVAGAGLAGVVGLRMVQRRQQGP